MNIKNDKTEGEMGRIKTVCEEIFQRAFHYQFNGGWILSWICGRICWCMTPLLRKYVWTKELAPEEKEKDEKRRAYLKALYAEWERIALSERDANPKITVREICGMYRTSKGGEIINKCYCDSCTCKLKGFRECARRCGCRTRGLLRRKSGGREED